MASSNLHISLFFGGHVSSSYSVQIVSRVHIHEFLNLAEVMFRPIFRTDKSYKVSII